MTGRQPSREVCPFTVSGHLSLVGVGSVFHRFISHQGATSDMEVCFFLAYLLFEAHALRNRSLIFPGLMLASLISLSGSDLETPVKKPLLCQMITTPDGGLCQCLSELMSNVFRTVPGTYQVHMLVFALITIMPSISKCDIYVPFLTSKQNIHMQNFKKSQYIPKFYKVNFLSTSRHFKNIYFDYKHFKGTRSAENNIIHIHRNSTTQI